MPEQTNNRIARLFEHTKTICIGRFVLEVPFESQIIYGPAELPYRLDRLVGKGENLDEVVEARKHQILTRDRKRAWGPLARQDSLLGRVLAGKVPSQKIVFGVSRASGSNYVLESYQRVGEDIFVQEIVLYRSGFEAELAELNKISPLLVPRKEDQSPTEAGVCLEGAFLREPVNPIHEYVTLGVRLNGFNDVHFSIEMTKKDRLVPSDALEPRIRRAELVARKAGAGSWYDRVKVFRRGTRIIGAWTGYEYLAWKPSFGEVGEAHEFAYVSQGVPSDSMQPVLDISLDTGVKDNHTSRTTPSINDEEALYLWDKLTGALRARQIQTTKP